MANQKHVDLLKQGVEQWNAWREKNPEIRPDLSGAYLREANLINADLNGASLNGASLFQANLNGANLQQADLEGACFDHAHLHRASLDKADLRGANLRGAYLHRAHLSGVTIISTRHEGIDYGLTASAVSSLSLDPPMLLICVNKTSNTRDAIEASRVFAVNILQENQSEAARQFATSRPDKFAGLSVSYGDLGVPLLDNLAPQRCIHLVHRLLLHAWQDVRSETGNLVTLPSLKTFAEDFLRVDTSSASIGVRYTR